MSEIYTVNLGLDLITPETVITFTNPVPVTKNFDHQSGVIGKAYIKNTGDEYRAEIEFDEEINTKGLKLVPGGSVRGKKAARSFPNQIDEFDIREVSFIADLKK